MKRIILIVILIVLYCFIIHEKTKDTFLEKIDLNLNTNGIGVVIADNKILIRQNDKNNLIMIDEDKSIDKFFKTFSVDKIDNLIYYNDDPKINSIHSMKGEQNLKINLNNYTFCLYEEEDTKDCTFIYLKEYRNDIRISSENKAIFYKETPKIEENLYTKWIDSFPLKKDEYIIIKINNDTYNIINVPIQ